MSDTTPHPRRWWILAVWVAFLVAAFGPVQSLTDNLSQGGFEVPGSQSDQVKRDIDRYFTDQFEFTDLLVMDSPALAADDPVFRRTFGRIKAAIEGAPGVEAVVDPYAHPERFISSDGHTLTATVGLSDNQDQALEHADDVDAAMRRANRSSGIQAILTGDAPFYRAFSQTTTHDLNRAERIAFPLALVILVIAFGSLVAAGLPLLMAIFGLLVSFGIISLIASFTTVSIFAENTASMLGIGVGIDYSLFILSRFRQRLKAGRDRQEAVAEAMASSGKAVFVSGLTVVIALAGTQLVNMAAFKSMGFSAMVAVGLAVIGALTLLPALLSLLGPRLNKLRVRKDRDVSTGIWHRWSGFIMRRPWPALIVALTILALLAWPARHLRLGSSGPDILPADSGPRVAQRLIARSFGQGQVSPVQVVITDPRGVTGPAFDDIFLLARAIEQDPEVTRVDSIATLVPGQSLQQAAAFVRNPISSTAVRPMIGDDGRKTLLTVVTRHGSLTPAVERFVKRLRSWLPGQVQSPAQAAVGGDPGLNVDINNEMTGKLFPVVAIVLVLSFFILLLFFRSVLLPLKAIFMNTASVLAAYGLMVFVFQEGHAQGLLDFRSVGFIDSFMPLFQFSILFGLSMDYEVFLLARMREEYLRTGDNTEAVSWGLEHTGGIITSAAAIMVVVFGAFAFTTLLPIKELGFGLATAVLLDATLVRIVLVPATV